MKTAIACASGSVKGVFVHGVLDAFRERGLTADAYAAASSSTIPAAFAAMGRLDSLKGPDYWLMCGDAFKECGDVSLSIKQVERMVSRKRLCLGKSQDFTSWRMRRAAPDTRTARPGIRVRKTRQRQLP